MLSKPCMKHILASKEDSSIVNFLDINDKYLVSGSFDGTCILWKLPDFKPIDRLLIPGNIASGVHIYDVTIYD